MNLLDFPGGPEVKNSPASMRNMDSIPGSEAPTAADLLYITLRKRQALEPVLHIREKSLQWEAHALQPREWTLLAATRESPTHSGEDPAQPKKAINWNI